MTNEQNELTDTQQTVLDFIIGFMAEFKYGPSRRDVATAFGWSVNGAMSHITALKTKGFIEWDERIARSMRVLKNE